MLPSRSTTSSANGPSSSKGLFKFDSSTSSDLLKKIRETRYQPSSTQFSSNNPNKRRPFIVRCFIPAVIALLLLYVFAFVEVGEIDIIHLKILGLSSKTKLAPDQTQSANTVNTNTNINTVTNANPPQNQQSQQNQPNEAKGPSADHVADHPIDQQTEEITKDIHTDNKAHYVDYVDDADNSKFVAMWHYLHESDFEKLSPALQTRKLHELFRYKYTDILVDRIKNKNFKIPSGIDQNLHIFIFHI